MQCRYCHKSIQYNSIYCNWCGGRQIVDRTSVSVPRPRKQSADKYMDNYFNSLIKK